MVDKSKRTEGDVKATTFTENNRRELAKARSMPISFDEAEIYDRKGEYFRRVNPARKEKRTSRNAISKPR